MIGDLNLGAYLHRIGLKEAPAHTLEGLQSLHLAHATHIPFENLDIQMGLPIHLDLGSLQAKLVDRKRGGYCFEHNTLFMAVLRQVGFDVEPFEARVRLGTAEVLPRTHMLLRVRLAEGAFLADVGFGGQGLLHPVPMDGEPHRAFGSDYRVIEEGPLRVLQTRQALEPVPKPPRTALGAPGGIPQERRDEHSGSTRFEPDAAGCRPPPQPEGTTPGGRSAASAPLNDEPHRPAGPSLRSIPPDVVAVRGGFGTGSWAWQDLYAFQPEPRLPIDFEMANWYTSTHPDSRFVKTLTAQLPGPEHRHILRGLSYTRVSAESAEERLLSVEELVPLLREVFGLEVPEDSTFRSLSPTLRSARNQA